MKKFLAICGVSGVGKTTIIKEILKIDESIIYISPDTNRELRENEHEKKHLSLKKLRQKIKNGDYIFVNEIYGNFYCTPKQQVNRVLEQNKTPILDFPITEIDKLYDFIGQINVYTIYIYPPNKQELKNRLTKDSRDLNGNRYQEALKELDDYKNGDYDDKINYKVESVGRPKDLAEKILTAYNAVLTRDFKTL